MVCCTQPRRVAAVSLAARVAEEMGVALGSTVGYSVRFDECNHREATRLLYLTDGMLINETMRDPLLSRYSIVMIDEAHERSLQTDVLLGLLKKVLRRRHDLRLLVASATVDAELFRVASCLRLPTHNLPVNLLPTLMLLLIEWSGFGYACA